MKTTLYINSLHVLQDVRLYDYGMIHPLEHYKPAKYNGIPALHLAAASGNPLAVKILLESGKINTLALDTLGNTALHYAASVGEDFMGCACFVSVRHYLRLPTIIKKDISDVMCCMELLMQVGLDMGQPNTRGATPELGPSSTSELKLWWYEKMAKETKSNLVATANAISVTAALVATTSFMGPLQPPLGVSTSTSPEEMWLNGYIEVNHVAVEVFLICDSLSFYLAIASIMLAVIPSLGVPEPGFSQKSVQFAVALLFASITFVICAFSAASIAILPEARNYKLLAIVTTIMGALVCLIALGLFFLRLLRLIKPKSKLVMRLNSASSNFLFHMW